MEIASIDAATLTLRAWDGPTVVYTLGIKGDAISRRGSKSYQEAAGVSPRLTTDDARKGWLSEWKSCRPIRLSMQRATIWNGTDSKRLLARWTVGNRS